jgi:hypothetical protein
MFFNLCLFVCIGMSVPISIFCMEKDLPVTNIVPQLTTTEMWNRCKVLMDIKIPHEQGGGQVKDLLHDLVRPDYSKQDCADLVHDQTKHIRNSMVGAAELLTYIAGSKPFRKLAEVYLNEDTEKAIAQHVLQNEIRFAQTGRHLYPNSQERNICITGSELGDVVLTCLTRPVVGQDNKVDIYELHKGELLEQRNMSIAFNRCVALDLNPCTSTQEQIGNFYDKLRGATSLGRQPSGQVVFVDEKRDNVLVVDQSPISIVSEFQLDFSVLDIFPSYQGDCLFNGASDSGVRLYTKEGWNLFTEPVEERYFHASPKEQYRTQALQLANGVIVALRGFKPYSADCLPQVSWDEIKAYNPYTAAVLWKKKVSEIADWKGSLSSATPGYMQLEAAGTDTAVLVHTSVLGKNNNNVVLIDSLSGRVKLVESENPFNLGTTDFVIKNCGENFVLIISKEGPLGFGPDILLFGKDGTCKQKLSLCSNVEAPYRYFYVEMKSYIHEHGLAIFKRRSRSDTEPAILHIFKTYRPQALTLEEAIWLKNSASPEAYDLYDRLSKDGVFYCPTDLLTRKLYLSLPRSFRTRFEQKREDAQKKL